MGLDVERQAGFSEALHKGRLFFVEFVGTPERAAAIDWIRQRGFPVARTTIRDASGRELLEVLQVTAAR
jgi:hypothetical protein